MTRGRVRAFWTSETQVLHPDTLALSLPHHSQVHLLNPIFLRCKWVKLQYFGHVMQRVDSLEKTLMLGGMDWGQEEKGTTEDEVAGWHH